MARGSNPGDDFDAQWNESKRRGQEKARRGESFWADDKYLERINAKPKPAHHAGQSSGCADKTVALLAFLGGLAWAVAETVQRIT